MSMFTHIRHISFDAWNTLIIPNLEFSAARSRHIAEVYGISYEQAKEAYTTTKRFLDTAAELTGFGTSVTNVYRLLNAQLKRKLSEEELLVLRQDINELFFEMPPTVPAPLVDSLHAIKEAGYTTNILSNTNFIGGQQLRVIFDEALGKNFFNFMLFSDEHDMAKPHAEFFRMVSVGANKIGERPTNGMKHLVCTEIMHVGDNEITDIAGAERASFVPLLVHDPLHTAIQLKLAEVFNHA